MPGRGWFFLTNSLESVVVEVTAILFLSLNRVDILSRKRAVSGWVDIGTDFITLWPILFSRHRFEFVCLVYRVFNSGAPEGRPAVGKILRYRMVNNPIESSPNKVGGGNSAINEKLILIISPIVWLLPGGSKFKTLNLSTKSGNNAKSVFTLPSSSFLGCRTFLLSHLKSIYFTDFHS